MTAASPPAARPWWERGPFAPPRQVPRVLLLMALAGLVWGVLSSIGLEVATSPDTELAQRLDEAGVRGTATEVREEVTFRGTRTEVEVTFEAGPGGTVTTRLSGTSSWSAEESDGPWPKGWRAGTGTYAAPLPVVYDPERPDEVMAAVDVDRYAGGRGLRINSWQALVSWGVVLAAVLLWLLVVAVRVVRKR